MHKCALMDTCRPSSLVAPFPVPLSSCSTSQVNYGLLGMNELTSKRPGSLNYATRGEIWHLGPATLALSRSISASAKLSHFKQFRQALVSLNLIARCGGGGAWRGGKRELQITPTLPLPHSQQPRFEHKHIAKIGSALVGGLEEEVGVCWKRTSQSRTCSSFHFPSLEFSSTPKKSWKVSIRGSLSHSGFARRLFALPLSLSLSLHCRQ